MDINQMAREHIGDGKLPNEYYVFQYDTKHKETINEDGICCADPIDENAAGKIIGRYKTYKAAKDAIYREAYLPHVIIEDRLSGMIFESMIIVCQCCGHEDYRDYEDLSFTKEKIECHHRRKKRPFSPE